ncbi:MAG: dihydropteroate synthase DHPS [Verrucomicrobia bacterium]|nr:MAG: dihydropteroate synthase DHPS [Verrucomicrobiota bacterium]
MAINGKLNIIAEKINDSVPSTHELFEKGDMAAIINLAVEQAAGATYIDVNIGPRDPALIEELVRVIQSKVNVPLSIDTPSAAIAERALKVYDPAKAGGRKPLLNSISLGRLEMFDLLKIQPCKLILMASERHLNGATAQNATAEDVHEAARQMLAHAKKHGLTNDDMIFDSTIAPIGSDYQGLTKMTVNGIGLIGSDPQFKGCHMSVGLSNFTVQLPSKTQSGALVKTPLENAFLTLAVPRGLDYCVGNTKKKYEFLQPDHPAMQTLSAVMKLEGYDILMRVQDFYNN